MDQEPIGTASQFALFMIPTAWAIARRFRTGQLAGPLAWIEPLEEGLTPQRILEAVEMYLDRDDAPVDLSNWVLSELPSGEVHMIDTTTDLLWAATLLLSLNPEVARDGFTIESYLYGRRDEFKKAMDGVASRLSDGTSTLSHKVVDGVEQLRRVVEAATTEYERAERLRIRDSPLSEEIVQRLTDSLRSTWQGGFIRSLLESVGSVRKADDAPPPKATLGYRLLERKDMFIADSRFVPSTGQMIGESLGRGITVSENKQILDRLLAVPLRSYGGRNLAATFVAAVKAMAATGITATHVGVPVSWKVQQRLVADGLTNETSHADGHVLGEVVGVPIVGWSDVPPDSAFLLSLPAAVDIAQYDRGGHPVSVMIRAIGPAEELELKEQGTTDVEGESSDTASERLRSRVLIDVFESFQLRVRRRAVRRLRLPADLQGN